MLWRWVTRFRTLWAPKPCAHPDECRDTVFNGAWLVEMCGLCGYIFDMQKPTKGT
jgi:hypothetical protein